MVNYILPISEATMDNLLCAPLIKIPVHNEIVNYSANKSLVLFELDFSDTIVAVGRLLSVDIYSKDNFIWYSHRDRIPLPKSEFDTYTRDDDIITFLIVQNVKMLEKPVKTLKYHLPLINDKFKSSRGWYRLNGNVAYDELG